MIAIGWLLLYVVVVAAVIVIVGTAEDGREDE